MKKVSEISKEYKISIRTLHYYDEIGLLIPVRVNGIRLFSSEDENRLKVILIYKESGLSLEEISTVLVSNDFGFLHKKRNELIAKRNRINDMITYIDGIELLNRHPMSTNELENPFNTPIRQILGDKQMNEFYPKYVTNDDYKHKLDNIFERFHVVKHNNLEMQNLIRDYYNYMNDDLFLHITKERFIEIIKQGLNQSDYLNNVDKVLFLTALEEFG